MSQSVCREMSLAAARPLVTVYNDKNESAGSTVCLPVVFRYVVMSTRLMYCKCDVLG